MARERDGMGRQQVNPERAFGERLRHWIKRGATGVVGLAAVGVLIVFLNPEKIGHALAAFRLGLIPAILGLQLLIYLLQGVRWHYLLRDAGARLRLSDSVLLNAAGQTITALVPLGDLTRAALAAEASDTDFGILAATVTVQELSYNVMLILCALPVLLTVHLGLGIVIATLIGIALILVILTVSPVFHVVHRLIVHVPLLNRFLPAIDELQAETATLLHRPDALLFSVLDLARAVAVITAFWLIVEGLAPGVVGWPQAALVLTLSSISGAITVVPGGVGANEASVTGLLVVFGVVAAPAGAVALMQRVLISVVALVLGWPAYLVAKRRYRLGSIFQLVAQRRGEDRSVSRAGQRTPEPAGSAD
ncbi:MAG: flippase-like domain-containing protein [Candidatus Dormibacteraeota bacterium]|nr:flippase-like domain-containing protein [Candidatus Dormibacteraeota bacterium]